jgi:hypothetical protein
LNALRKNDFVGHDFWGFLVCSFALLVTTAVVVFAPIFWVYPRLYTWRVGVPLRSIRRACTNYSKHLKGAAIEAVPYCGSKDSTIRHLWSDLAAAALEGHWEPDVLKKHCHDGIDSRPVLFCNFQAYARAVTRVLETAQKMACKQRGLSATVYTLFKRPIADWYNPFPWNHPNGKVNVTLPWWEDYKAKMAKMAAISRTQPAGGGGSCLRVMRLVAQPSGAGSESWVLINDRAFALLEAARQMKGAASPRRYHPNIACLSGLKTVRSQGDLSVYLIAQPDGPNETKLVQHFEETYHTEVGDGLPDRWGVFLKYLPRASGYENLLQFDDIFIALVRYGDCGRSFGFGLAFIDDETRDVNGMWIVSRANLTERNDAAAPTLLQMFTEAWRAGQTEVCDCNNLKASSP